MNLSDGLSGPQITEVRLTVDGVLIVALEPTVDGAVMQESHCVVVAEEISEPDLALAVTTEMQGMWKRALAALALARQDVTPTDVEDLEVDEPGPYDNPDDVKRWGEQ